MGRAPFQVLVLPYRRLSSTQTEQSGQVEYALFSRADYPCWQFVSGGGEAQESPVEAAKREAFEEAGIDPTCPFRALDTRTSVPVYHFAESRNWGEEIFVVPEYTFAVDANLCDFRLSIEHNEYQWLPYGEAFARLTYDGNRTALWELNQRLIGKGPRGSST